MITLVGKSNMCSKLWVIFRKLGGLCALQVTDQNEVQLPVYDEHNN